MFNILKYAVRFTDNVSNVCCFEAVIERASGLYKNLPKEFQVMGIDSGAEGSSRERGQGVRAGRRRRRLRERDSACVKWGENGRSGVWAVVDPGGTIRPCPPPVRPWHTL